METNIVPAPRGPVEAHATPPRVVVGVDGSVASVRALMWAVEFAAAGGAVVEVITAWPLHGPVVAGEVSRYAGERSRAVLAQREVVKEVAGLISLDVPVLQRVERAGALDALTHAADGAELVVVGARRSFPTDDADGPTLAEVLQTATRCPVLEVSSLGAVSLPWGEFAFRSSDREASDTARTHTPV